MEPGKNIPPEDQVQVDVNRVMASYQRQIADQASKVAVQEAIIETQRDEISRLRQIVDELAPKQSESETPRPNPGMSEKKEEKKSGR